MSTYLLCAGNKENKGRKQEGKNRRKFLYCKNNYLEALIWLSLVGQNITSLSYSHIAGADLGGGCRGWWGGGAGAPPPPPPPDMTCGFLIQLVFCQKKKLCGLLVLK